MKKIFSAILIACLFSISSFSQESKGKISIDMNFDPAAFFDASAGPMFVVPFIKGRYFLSSDVALRLGFDLGLSSNKTYPDPTLDDYSQNSSFSWTIAPGIEKEFGSDKFFVYVGAEVPISGFSSSSKTETAGTVIETENQGGGYTMFGVNGVFGADYYLFPNFYVGAEFTPGLSFTSHKDRKTDGVVTTKGGSGYTFGLGASSGIRIGFRF